MEEYEVDLRDYLRVMWERKWIILGVFVAAVLAAALYSYSLPDEYEATALLRWEGEADLQGVTVDLPAINSVVELLKIIAVQPKTEFRVDLLGNSRSRSGFIQVRVQGPLPSAELERLLQERIDAVRDFLKGELEKSINVRLASLSQQVESLMRQREALLQDMEEWITSRVEEINRQEKELLAQLGQIQETLDKEGASAEEALWASGLIAQLQALSQERLRLQGELASPYPRPGSGFDAQLAKLDASLQELTLSQEMYRAAAQGLREGLWSPLRIVRPPQGTADPVGPPRTLNVAVSGVLGLFVGILLAFFVNYLQSEPLGPAPTSQQENSPKGEAS